jgi:cytoskeletal protein CcmA (bactofilin family)
MKRPEILRRLEERLARGEISEKTYLDIKARYESEPEEAEPVPEPAFDASVEASLGEAVSRVAAGATQAAQQAVRAAGEAMRAVDFGGMGVRLSEEAIKIAGSGVVSGRPVRTREFKAAGSARVEGDLEAEVAKVAGSCSFDGNVRVEEFRSSGSVRIAGDLRAENVESSGSIQVDGNLTAEEVVTSGSLRVAGAVQAERFHASGTARIEGDLTAEEVLIEMSGSSALQNVKAEQVEVRSMGGFLRSRGDLAAERIEAEEIRIEGTVASFVKGERVHVGPHCRIGVVEAGELVVHESSEVRERHVASE